MAVSDYFVPVPDPNRILEVSTVPELISALKDSQFMDHVVLADGTYLYNDILNMPTVSVILRAKNPLKALFRGQIRMSAGSWVKDLDISQPTASAESLVIASNNNTHVINNVIHDSPSGINGIISGGGSKGGYIYGNLIYRTRHIAYMQNSDTAYPRFVVQNYLGDVLDKVDSDNARVIHSYTESPHNGLALRYYENFINGGRVTIGGQNLADPPQDCQFIGNFFWKSYVEGYKRPHATMFKRNNFYRSTFDHSFLWGRPEEQYPSPGRSVVLRNNFYNPGQLSPYVKTSHYKSLGTNPPTYAREDEGKARLYVGDQWDQNRYYGGFRAALGVDGVFHAEVTSLLDWSNYTEAAGNRFDVHSTVLPGTPQNKVTEFVNLYDNSRSLVVVENWNGRGIKVMGKLYDVHDLDTVVFQNQKVTTPEVSVWVKRS